MSFKNLGLIEPILRAIESEGYERPTPIQQQAIPPLLSGRDFLGCAQTGTGKTAAFALPILQRLQQSKSDADGKHKHPPIRALILTPTRELAAQIDESFKAYGKNITLSHSVIYGGVKQGPQTRALKKGVDILVATPGRLLDLIGQGFVHLEHVEVFVLDEADRMLDMGFIRDVRKIINRLPEKRQNLLFSATMPPEIQHLADEILDDPQEVRIAPETPAAETVDHTVYLVEHSHKRSLLEHLLADDSITRVLVFTRTKHGAERLARHLKSSKIQAEAIHSNKTQGARKQTLANFKAGKTRVLVASDILARGIDVDDISHVVNYDIPHEPEVYVHRIGRTGRAGAKGKAFSFCGIEERALLEDIEKLLRQTIPTADDHPFPSPLPRASQKKAPAVVGTTRPRKRRISFRRR